LLDRPTHAGQCGNRVALAVAPLMRQFEVDHHQVILERLAGRVGLDGGGRRRRLLIRRGLKLKKRVERIPARDADRRRADPFGRALGHDVGILRQCQFEGLW
jgi:hypothetical protein